MYFSSTAAKLTWASFINSGLVVLLIEFWSGNIGGRGGLIQNVFYILVIQAFLPPILKIFYYKWFYLKYKRWRLQSLVDENPDGNDIDIDDVRPIFSGIPLSIDTIYASIMKTMWLAIFYAPVMPIGLVLCLIGMVLFYWA
jgi:hypothetical protein